MSDIFREVDEEVRNDKLLALAKKWGPYVVGGAVGIVLATSAYVWMENKEEAAKRADSAAYEAAMSQLNDGNTDAGLTALTTLSANSETGYAALADLRRGSFLLKEGKKDEALLAFSAAANKPATERITSLAKLNHASLLVDMGRYDEAAGPLEALSVEGSAWEASAKELLAFIAYEKGDMVTASDLYEKLSLSQEIPPAVKQRASQMLEVIKQKQATPKSGEMEGK